MSKEFVKPLPIITDETKEAKDRILGLIAESKQKFLKGEDVTRVGESDCHLYKTTIDGIEYRVFGIHKDKQQATDYAALRASIYAELGRKSDARALQVVGDSNRFNLQESNFARKFFKDKMAEMEQSGDFLLLYGFTGHLYRNAVQDNAVPDPTNFAREETPLDVNHLVTEYLDDNPEMTDHVLANIVCGHTPTAMLEWNCNISGKVRNFFLVYANAGERALFGDDTISSDKMSDEGLCVEGGIQSYRQTVYMLRHGKPVIGIENLRDSSANPEYLKKDSKDAAEETRKAREFFSASKFLNLIKARFLAGRISSEASFDAVQTEYLSTCSLADPERGDYETKGKLFAEACAQLDGHKVEFMQDLKGLYTACEYDRSSNSVVKKSAEVASSSL